MSTPERISLTANDGVVLQGAIYEPSQKAKGTIHFIPGYIGKFWDYENVISPLAQTYRVVTFNPRGVGGSQGIIDAATGERDLAEICAKYPDERTSIVAHSYAAYCLHSTPGKSANAIILLSPYVNHTFLPFWTQIGIRALHKMRAHLKPLDKRLSHRKLVTAKGMDADAPLATVAALADEDVRTYAQIATPMLYLLADQDKTLGTDNQGMFVKYKRVFDNVSTQAEDASDLCKGLNHCLNKTPDDFAPFLRAEQGKDSDAILQRIHDFLEKQN